VYELVEKLVSLEEDEKILVFAFSANEAGFYNQVSCRKATACRVDGAARLDG